MVKKRVGKSGVRRKSRKVSAAPETSQSFGKVRPTRNRIKIVVKNLILFVVLSLVFYVLKIISVNPIYETFFYFLYMILGFIALALLISLLVMLLLKALKR